MEVTTIPTELLLSVTYVVMLHHVISACTYCVAGNGAELTCYQPQTHIGVYSSAMCREPASAFLGTCTDILCT